MKDVLFLMKLTLTVIVVLLFVMLFGCATMSFEQAVEGLTPVQQGYCEWKNDLHPCIAGVNEKSEPFFALFNEKGEPFALIDRKGDAVWEK